MSWFTKYRPKTVSQLHLQSVRENLLRLINSGSFPHALLFSGPKGTGKTSSARIVAALLNDPHNEPAIDYIFFGKQKPQDLKLAEPDPDLPLSQKIYTGESYVVNEMDAASNRGIDDIRILKERLNLPPQEGKIAVYILDEVHMLTTEAFNALLKVLEEPPKHVVFILATTERHKLPATIISRCVEINFHKASVPEIVDSLKKVLDSEQIEYEIEVLEQIAVMADGSFRDAVKILESCVSGKNKLTLENLDDNFAQIDQDIAGLVTSLINRDEQGIVTVIGKLRNQNVDTKYCYKALVNYLHHQLMIALNQAEGKTKFEAKILVFLLSEFNHLEINQHSPIELLDLELKFLELIYRSKEKNQAPPSEDVKKNSPKQPPKVVACDAVINEKIIIPSDPLANPLSLKKGSAQAVIDHWSDFLSSLKDKNISLELLLHSAKPVEASEQLLTIEVYYHFHQEQLQQPKFFTQIKDCMCVLAGGVVDLKFVLAKQRPEIEVENVNISPVPDDDLVELAKQALV